MSKELMTLCLLLCFSGAIACDTNLIISGSSVDCVIDGNTEVCEIVTQSLITLPTLGSTICLTVLNEESNLVMGFINITYDQSWAVAGLHLEYYTSNREILSVSHKACGGSAFCSQQIDCATPRSASQIVTMSGALSGPATLFPGVSGCSDGCGCAGCRCYMCNEACVYRRYAVRPIPSIWRVMTVATSRLVPKIEICYGTSMGAHNCSSQPFVSGSTRTIGDNFTMTYIGSYQTSFNFLGYKLLTNHDRTVAHFIQASEKNLPVAGTIGEIQGNSISSFVNATPTSYIIANDICTPYLSDSIAYYDCVANPFFSLQSPEGLLPHTLDGVYWQYSSDDTLVGNVLNPPGLALSMQSTGSLIFKTTRIQVCPWMEFIEISGIWGSATGAKATIKAQSTCLPGKCVLSAFSTKIEMDSVFLTLSTDVEDHEVFFRSNTKEVLFELTCKSLAESYTIEIKGELDDPTPINPIEPPGPPDDFNHWFDDLSLGAKIGFGIGVGLAGLLIIIGLILLMWYMPQIVAWAMKYQKVHSVEKENELKIKDKKSDVDTTTYSDDEELTNMDAYYRQAQA